MTTAQNTRRKRQRGEIEELPSGALRVKVYAGKDPLTGKRHYLRETIDAGPKAATEAEKARTRLLNEVDERRNPRTNATVNQLMDRYLKHLNVDVNTRVSYEGYIRNHIRPLLGKMPIARLDGETFDSFYLILRTCRAHCDGRKFIQHRKEGAHDCTEKCKPHECSPLSTSAIRQIHWCLNTALKMAIRWRWLSVNPLDQATPPDSVTPNPKPPSAEQAAAIINEAFKDLDWGMLVWVAMTTGARRGEVCAMTLDRLDLSKDGKESLSIETSIAQRGARTWEKPTKTHQQRIIALDKQTAALLRSYLAHSEHLAQQGKRKLVANGRLFSSAVDHSTWLKPDTVGQRYRRMCEKLGWDMNIHQLRHYSATELIAAGVDIRTVAGRLGHGGGGSTTLRVYSAWSSEADQRAAGNLADHMPTPPVAFDEAGAPTRTIEDDPDSTCKKIAADLRGAIACGAIKIGDKLPPMAELANRYGVVANTAQRAVKLLAADNLVKVSRGKRAVVVDPADAENQLADVVPLSTA